MAMKPFSKKQAKPSLRMYNYVAYSHKNRRQGQFDLTAGYKTPKHK